MKKKTILIIDNDRDLVDALATRCESIGLNVLKAHNVLTAVVLMDRKFPDVMCVDIQMPTGNGLTFLEIVGLDPGAAKIPAIVLTGKNDHATRQRVKSVCAYYVHKSPSSWNKIKTFIHETVDLGNTNPVD